MVCVYEFQGYMNFQKNERANKRDRINEISLRSARVNALGISYMLILNILHVEAKAIDGIGIIYTGIRIVIVNRLKCL